MFHDLYLTYFPVADNHSLVNQVKDYMKKEEFYNKEKFDVVINDGDMGSNVLAKKRGIPSLFVTNQYMPKNVKSRSYFYQDYILYQNKLQRLQEYWWQIQHRLIQSVNIT